MTTGSHPTPFRVPVIFQQKSGLIVLDQIRALDKTRLIRKLGTLESKTLGDTLTVLQDLFAQ